ncbi:MAG TPA: hypothetical protein VFY71_02915 [Planctomycetota bacterium]|nr:hypothetical protein [Planctomycetota bacterium]
MFKTRYTVTARGSQIVVRQVGKSPATVLARRIPLTHAKIVLTPTPDTERQGPQPKRTSGRKKR